LKKAHKNKLINSVKKGRSNVEEIWGYINQNFESIFGAKNQVSR